MCTSVNRVDMNKSAIEGNKNYDCVFVCVLSIGVSLLCFFTYSFILFYVNFFKESGELL